MDKILVLKSDERFGEDSLLLAWQYLRHSVWKVLPPLLFGNTKATFSQATLVRLVNATRRKSAKRAVHRRNSSCARLLFHSAFQILIPKYQRRKCQKIKLLENNPLLRSRVLSPAFLFFAEIRNHSHSSFSPAESFRPTPEPTIFVCEYSEISARGKRTRETVRARDSKRAP